MKHTKKKSKLYKKNALNSKNNSKNANTNITPKAHYSNNNNNNNSPDH